MHRMCVAQPPVTVCLDGRALSMYEAAKQAIADFLPENKLPQVFKTKLMFYHSDVLRGTATRSFARSSFFTRSCPRPTRQRSCAASACPWMSSALPCINGLARCEHILPAIGSLPASSKSLPQPPSRRRHRRPCSSLLQKTRKSLRTARTSS